MATDSGTEETDYQDEESVARPASQSELVASRKKKLALQKVYGPDFPGFGPDNGEDWKVWLGKQFSRQAELRSTRQLHYLRHDRFRIGDQWLSTRDSRTWRVPQASKNELRPVLNLIGPSLDFILGLLMEQRPGFAYQPINTGTNGREVAEAQQAVAEYYFYQLRAWQVFLDATFFAQNHGASFIQVYVDKTRGPSRDDVMTIDPSDERYENLVALGYEKSDGGVIVPLDEDGDMAEPGAKVRKLYEGELAHRVVLAHEILVDPEARTINGPMDAARWLIMRRARDVATVKIELGKPDMEAETRADSDSNYDGITQNSLSWQRGLPPFPSARTHRIRDMVWEYCIYFAPDSNALPDGAWLKIIGNDIVEQGDELPGGVIPFARFTDGSSDPAMFPLPRVANWLPKQISINALLQQALQSARLGGGRLLSQKNSVIEETYSKVIGSLLEYSGAKPDVINGIKMSPDIMPLLGFMIKQLENETGWSDLARGQMTGDTSLQDVSGRALLGAKELFERTFGPAVRAVAQGATEWAEIVVKYSQYIMSTPRMIPRVGRPDLAISISKEKLGTDSVVYCDPETLMPLPKSLRMQMLQDSLEKGLITVEQYQQRAPYAEIRNLTMGDTSQWERAKWVNTVLEERHEELATMDPTVLYAPAGIPILWQDVPKVHKQALQELVLNERKPWELRKLASDRWGIYDQMERAMNDMTFQYPIPWEVIGAPPDRVLAPVPQPGGAIAPPGGQPVAAPGPGAVPPASAPAPDVANGQQAGNPSPPLGGFGAVERQSEGSKIQ